MALEALKAERTVSDLAIEYGVHPTMIRHAKLGELAVANDPP